MAGAGGPSIAVRVLGDLKGFASAVSGAGSQVQSSAGRMKSAFGGVTGALNQTGVLGPFSATLDGIGTALDSVGEHGRSAGIKLMGIGGALTGIGAGLSIMGSKDQAAQQQLSQAIDATGASFDDYSSAIEEAIGHQEKYGHTANETQDALRLLTNATHDPQKALDMLGEASDVAASKHEDFATAATQLGKVYNGNTKLLKEYGISIDKTTGLTKDGQTATEALAKVTGGQASAAADTFAGKLRGIKAGLEDQVAQLGQKYGPALQVAGMAMVGLGSAMEVIPALLDSQAAAWVANAAGEMLALWPILAIIAAVALIGVGIYELVTHWAAVWGAIKAVFSAVWDFITDHWKLLIVIFLGPFGALVALIATYWDQIKAIIMGVLDVIIGVVQTVISYVMAVVNVVVTVFSAIFDVIHTIIDSWVGRIEALISNIIQWLTDAFALVVGILTTPFNIARDLIVGAIDVILFVIGTIAGWIQGAVATVVDILSIPFAIARDLIIGAVNAFLWVIGSIISVVSTAVSTVASVLSYPFGLARDLISTAISAIGGFVSGIPDAISTALEGVENIIAAPFRVAKDIIDTICGDIGDAVGKITGPISKVLDVGGKIAGGIGGVLGLQSGGIVTQPTLALIGEAGPEAVIPLHHFNTITPQQQNATRAGGGPVVNIETAHFHDDADVETLMRSAAWAARTAAV